MASRLDLYKFPAESGQAPLLRWTGLPTGFLFQGIPPLDFADLHPVTPVVDSVSIMPFSAKARRKVEN